MLKNSFSTLKIISKSRLHITLLSLHSNKYRINGGFGFAIREPECKLEFSISDIFSISDNRTFNSTSVEIDRLLGLLKTEKMKYGLSCGYSLAISGKMRSHSGFGSGTAITLACIEALHLLNDSIVTPSNLIAASGRGGTSGVGVHSYFSGGYVFDLGRRKDSSAFAPSHVNFDKPAPLLLDQGNMPDWDFGICIPHSITHKTQAEERAFFERTCPLSSESVYETVYHTLFGLYAALREGDKVTFCSALKTVQHCAWKNAERLEYGDDLLVIEQSIYAAGADAVGMSSLGPSLFFLADDVHEIVNRMRALRPDCEWLVTKPENHGRQIDYG